MEIFFSLLFSDFSLKLVGIRFWRTPAMSPAVPLNVPNLMILIRFEFFPLRFPDIPHPKERPPPPPKPSLISLASSKEKKGKHV